ncbi:hypothetical protein LshimejAT787_1204730 [Lyophyllum shimeji]|uniref:Uncharacterized protein n=1 Tax=Lyophyllum shimeji TaxID=47721 RepID=A0A9P3UPD8_LYOSH|nr:hypothetical protein LshimejAT787_0600520 [Lyophyllum shimeji]GLB43024.1 hypothetical protein LshimejAT787_1204730 [Lyophyllum shimeji]
MDPAQEHFRKFEHCSDQVNNEAYGTTEVGNVDDSASVPSTRVVVSCFAEKGGFKDTSPELLSHVLCAAYT